MAENELVPMDTGALVRMHDADFDRQIATAKKWPRSVGRATADILAYATSSEDVAAECNYALPRAGKVIQGPSVRLAEICGTSWGNARYAARIIDEGRDFITAQGVFFDLEINNMISIEVQRRIVDSNNQRYGVDMIGTTGQAAMSIALRNVIFKGIPKSVWGDAYAKARAMVAGTIETLDKRRASALEAFKKQGVTDDMVLQLLDRATVRDIAPDDLVVLRGVLTAVRDGEANIRSIFGNMESGRARGSSGLGDKLAKGKANDSARDGVRDGTKDDADRSGLPEDRGSGSEAGSSGQSSDQSNDPGTSDDGLSREGGDGAKRGSEDHSDQASTAEPDGASPSGTSSGNDGAGRASVAASPMIESPKLDEAAAEILEGAGLDDEWLDRLSKLVESLRSAATLKAVNAAWDKVSTSFDNAPEEVDRAASALRSAKARDVRAAANAAKSSAASLL